MKGWGGGGGGGGAVTKKTVRLKLVQYFWSRTILINIIGPSLKWSALEISQINHNGHSTAVRMNMYSLAAPPPAMFLLSSTTKLLLFSQNGLPISSKAPLSDLTSLSVHAPFTNDNAYLLSCHFLVEPQSNEPSQDQAPSSHAELLGYLSGLLLLTETLFCSCACSMAEHTFLFMNSAQPCHASGPMNNLGQSFYVELEVSPSRNVLTKIVTTSSSCMKMYQN